MPTKPKQHRPAAPTGAKPARPRPTSTQRGYDRRWSRLARWHRRRHPLCADPFGLHEGRLVAGEHVDHVVPLSQGGTNETSNLQTLCRRCHARKTVLYDGGFGRARCSTNEGRGVEDDGIDW
jgi:5-methylcytosine-specific restriction endonuclease McrA